MKKIALSLVLSTLVLSINACSNNVAQVDNSNINQSVSAQSVTRDSVYPFSVEKDFFPLYNQTQWSYDIFDQNNKLITSLTKTLDVSNVNSLELDSKNKYYIVALKKSYSNPDAAKDKEEFEFIRRKDNQLAFGRLDDITYYPDSKKTTAKGSYDPYLFRPFVDFPTTKLETVKVKAGTFQCVKSEFTLKLDKYTIWYAKGIGEIKRLKEGYFSSYRFELSSYNNAAKQFVLSKETMELKQAPQPIIVKATQLKDQFLQLNKLPADLFDTKGNNIFSEIKVTRDNYKKTYDVSYLNKSIVTKDNVSFAISLNNDSSVTNMTVFGENNGKPTYQGKIVDKLPTLIK